MDHTSIPLFICGPHKFGIVSLIINVESVVKHRPDLVLVYKNFIKYIPNYARIITIKTIPCFFIHKQNLSQPTSGNSNWRYSKAQQLASGFENIN